MTALDGMRLGRAAGVNLAAGAVGAVANLLIAALVGRHLGVVGAGYYFLVVAVFMIAANTIELGADTGLVRFVSAAHARGRPEEIAVVLRSAVRPVLVAAGLLVGATAVIVLATDPLVGVPPWLLIVASAVAGSLAMVAVLLGVPRGYGDSLVYPALQNLLLPLGRLAAIGLAVAAGWGLSGVLAAWLVPVPLVLVVAVAITVRLLRRTESPATIASSDRRELGATFWKFSTARGFAACVEITLEWIDVVLVGILASPAAAGVYAVVTRCLRASEVVQQAARVVVGPQISAALARGDTDHARDIYGVVTAAMIWVTWPFFILLALFGDQVLRVFGPGFDSGAVPMGVLAAAMAIATAAGTVQSILLMGGRSTWQLADKTGALVLNVTLNMLLIPMWGITGAALAWAVTIVADTAIVVWQVQRLMGIRPSGRHLRPAIIQPVVLLALPGLAARLILGSSVTTMVAAVMVLGAVYLVVGWKTRRVLGFTRLVAIRSWAAPTH